MIKISKVTKKYGDTTAVNDVDLTIEKGQIVGLLGPNGAGKSTTMKIVSGYLIPDSGEVSIDDKSMRVDPIACKKKIGYMPENNPLYKDMLVKDAIAYSLKLRNASNESIKKRTDYVVKVTGLKEVYNKPISELSKGYKQRVGLAQVLAGDPEILILDEPTEGLDPNQRRDIRNLIIELGKNKTVIISTHVMQEVEAMCNRIILINKGTIVADGDIASVLKDNKGDSIINLAIQTKDDKPESEIKKIKGVVKVIEANKSKDIRKYEVATKNAKSFFDDFSKLYKKSDWTLLELNQKQTNLEEIFKQLTK